MMEATTAYITGTLLSNCHSKPLKNEKDEQLLVIAENTR